MLDQMARYNTCKSGSIRWPDIETEMKVDIHDQTTRRGTKRSQCQSISC